ncbi:permease [Zhongshania marina]|uniref:Permease n=1 Tax=Zhongshania marina TaxID=2304603 RepID=A0ABX9W561_9GAMM|nr:permease [Zhongshania marina]
MATFLEQWQEAALTSAGFFWMAFWAFGLGYFISSLIQVLVTKERMKRTMGEAGAKSVLLGTFFGFISSSCSFAALSTTRALFQKGAGLIPSLAFLLASTNLVVELGIVIAIFLGWQFVVGEYVGGLFLILFIWVAVKATNPRKMIEDARKKNENDGDGSEKEVGSWREKVRTLEGWQAIAKKYVMEWQMVWMDVLIGFTVAGVIAAFVPDSFFQALFLGSGGEQAANPGFISVLAQTLIGPFAAFLTFIGSMGNIPLAALLFGQGVSFAGVMAFIFSDLVVLPVLRINAAYYGWKMALYILSLMLIGLVCTSIVLHYGLVLLDMLPTPGQTTITDQDHFKLNYTFVLNIIFLGISILFIWLWRSEKSHSGTHHHHKGGGKSLIKVISGFASLWIVVGLGLAGWNAL